MYHAYRAVKMLLIVAFLLTALINILLLIMGKPVPWWQWLPNAGNLSLAYNRRDITGVILFAVLLLIVAINKYKHGEHTLTRADHW